MPESISNCGELMAPLATITSRRARDLPQGASAYVLQAHGRLAVRTVIFVASDRVRTVRLLRAADRAQVRTGCARTPPAIDRRLRQAEAVRLGRVQVVEDRIAGCPRGLQDRPAQGVARGKCT